jgi:hypothetical protein
MKTKILKPIILTFIVGIITALTFSACTVSNAFLSSAVVPAAQGTVVVKKDANENYAIRVSVTNLAGPERLTPAKVVYVVWSEARDGRSKNLGNMNISDGLNGRFDTVSAFRPMKIFITAEEKADVQYPTLSELILTTGFLN